MFFCNRKVNFDHFCYRYCSACMLQNASFVFINIKNCSKIWLCLRNPQGKKSPRDHKVRITILAIIEEFFNKNKAALLYICETGDGMQKMRSRLFQYWFSVYNEKEEYLFLPQVVYDEEDNENYAALIIRKDNPCFVELVSEFTETINLLNGKPD